MPGSISRAFCLLGLVGAACAQSAGPLIVLIGPPASGKTTQAQILQKDLGMAVVSVEDLIAQNRQAFERFRRPAIQGVEPRLDPALNRLVEERLRAIDRSKGVVLDGYPASKGQGDHLASLTREFHLTGPIVVQIRVSDTEVRKRASKDGNQDVEQGLKDYHRELDFSRSYFPPNWIHEIDGTKPVPDVAKEIRKVLASAR
jgi:adenylate kinase